MRTPLCSIFFFLGSIVWAGSQAPVSIPDAYTTDQGVPVFMDVIANDYDPGGDPLMVELVIVN